MEYVLQLFVYYVVVVMFSYKSLMLLIIRQIFKMRIVKINFHLFRPNRLCGLVVSVADYRHRGPGFDSRALLFLRELGLERGPLSLVIG
jgi:hypothetical protein